MGGKADDADTNIRALIFALLALACGHMLSTLLRTVPAISLDVMAADFRTAPQTLASLTSVYHFAFAASQIPVGAAMDRFGVRPVSLSLLAGTIVGALASGLATGPEGFLFGQLLLGVATSGMLMCPMTLAAKQMSAARFGLWSGIILSIGNIGMLLSASPLAFVVELWGLWGGPWLMEIKAFGRIEAGNMLGLFTLALIAGPVLMGMLDRSIGHRREVLAATHCLAALLLALMAAGAPHYPLSELLGVKAVPAQIDGALFVLIGIAISTQPLLYGMTRQLVDAQNAGKALSAINLAFFLGAALMQSSTGVVATILGLPAVLLFMAAALIAGTIVFLMYT